MISVNKYCRIQTVALQSEYSPDERIIISGIVHLGLPSLFMKINCCLNFLKIVENKICIVNFINKIIFMVIPNSGVY